MNSLEHNTGLDSTERTLGLLLGKIDGIHLTVTSICGEVKSLRDDFGTMEKGRLSKLELNLNTLETTLSAKAKNQGFWYAIFASILASVISGVILYLLLNK